MAAKVDAEKKTNTIDPERLKKVIFDIESKIDAKLSNKMEYVESCKSYNEDIANAYEMGAAFVPKKVLKVMIKERELRRKLDGVADDLEDEQRDTFEMVSQALGDYGNLPLGQAAKDRAAKADAAADTAPPKRPRGRPRKAPSPDAAAPPAAANDEAEDDEPDLRSDSQKLAERQREEEADRVAAENAERLGAGIAPLH